MLCSLSKITARPAQFDSSLSEKTENLQNELQGNVYGPLDGGGASHSAGVL